MSSSAPRAVGERGRRARAVHEDQAVPLGDRQLVQPPLLRGETRLVLEPGRRPQAPVQGVGPGVVGADDHLLLGGRAARQQLVPPVAARVRERVQHALVVADQQHAALADRLRPLVARPGYLVAASHAHPAAAEEMSLLPREHGRVHIGGAGEHAALAEGCQRRGERGLVDGGGGSRRLTDHTVKAMRGPAWCPAGADGARLRGHAAAGREGTSCRAGARYSARSRPGPGGRRWD